MAEGSRQCVPLAEIQKMQAAQQQALQDYLQRVREQKDVGVQADRELEEVRQCQKDSNALTDLLAIATLEGGSCEAKIRDYNMTVQMYNAKGAEVESEGRLIKGLKARIDMTLPLVCRD
jgi:hypothetical protein